MFAETFLKEMVKIMMDISHEGMLRFESYLWSKYSKNGKNGSLC